tara:strand:- start:2042 stop:2356 length:315 start_codon:yes stop_codon:yes gene_type:complete
MASKVNLIKRATKDGIPTFGNPSVAELEHRLSKWRSGPGWVVRRLHQKALPDWAGVIPIGVTLWLPNSSFTHRLMRTGKIVLITRSKNPPEGAIIVDSENDEEE